MLRARFVAPARRELADAVRWYRTEASAERASDFRSAITRVVARAASFPLSARVIDRVASIELRGFVVTGYPYVVVAAPMGRELVIYAVAHQSREPGYWMPRLASVRP